MTSNMHEAVLELALCYGLLALFALIPIVLMLAERRRVRREQQRRSEQGV